MTELKLLKLDVPLYLQETHTDCGPTCLKMIFSYFGEKIDKQTITKYCEPEKSGAVWTMGLALCAVRFGFKAEFYSKTLEITTDNFDLEYVKQNIQSVHNSINKLKFLKEESIKHGAKLYDTQLTLDQILEKTNEKCIPIVLIDWGTVENLDGKHPTHLVPIVGYDEKYIYIHEPSPKHKRAYFKIEKSLFDKARKAQGTDEDIAFIYRKEKQFKK